MKSHHNLVIISADERVRRDLARRVEREGYNALTVGDFDAGLAMARRTQPNLVILDMDLADVDPYEALKILRRQLTVPVMSIGTRGRDLDEILALKLGADDYLAKPLNHDVIMARAAAVLRRGTSGRRKIGDQPLVVGPIEIDPRSHAVIVDNEPVHLAPREFELLYTLALEAGTPISTDELLARIWGAEYVGESQIVYVHIFWLREKLERDPHNPEYIITVHRVGYRLNSGEATSESTAA